MSQDARIADVAITRFANQVLVSARLVAPPAASWRMLYVPEIVYPIAFGLQPRLVEDRIEILTDPDRERDAVVVVSATVAAVNRFHREAAGRDHDLPERGRVAGESH